MADPMNEAASGLEKMLAALIAAALSYLLAAGALVLLAGRFEGWTFVALFAAGPAAILAPMPSRGRIFSLVLGLLALAGSCAVELGGPDSPLLMLPVFASSLAGAAAVAELVARALRRLFAHPGAPLSSAGPARPS